MKLYYNGSPGLPLTGSDSHVFGDIAVRIDPELALTSGAIDEGRLVRADLTLDEEGLLVLKPERQSLEGRALIAVNLPVLEGGYFHHTVFQTERKPVRIVHMHTTHHPCYQGSLEQEAMLASSFHAIALLNEGTGVTFLEQATVQPLFGTLRRWLGGNPKVKRRTHRYFFEFEAGNLLFEQRHYTI